MKKIYDFKIMTLMLVIGFAVAPVTAFAADLWSETPDLFNDEEVASVETGPAEFTSSIPRIDMWAEAPDHLLRHEDHGDLIDTTPQVVNTFKPEMYAETPDLDSGQVVLHPCGISIHHPFACSNPLASNRNDRASTPCGI